jgi:molybdopterin-binding protein
VISKTGAAGEWLPLPNMKGPIMKISARNVIKGIVKSVNHGPVSAEIVISVAKGLEISSVITTSAAKELGLKKGVEVYAVIKASNVMVAID